jgi:hypothetical protein
MTAKTGSEKESSGRNGSNGKPPETAGREPDAEFSPLALYTNKIVDHLFPPDVPSTLLILKAHLLIHEALKEFPAVRHKQNRLSFKDLLGKVAKSPGTPQEFGWVWPAVDKLNKIRNETAHHLEPVGLQKLVVDFLEHVRGFLPEDLKSEEADLRVTLIRLCGCVASLLDHAQSRPGS